eukprot:scaffold5363_cov400-Prasinococcus_capsulatus_cf.AAC.8
MERFSRLLAGDGLNAKERVELSSDDSSDSFLVLLGRPLVERESLNAFRTASCKEACTHKVLSKRHCGHQWKNHGYLQRLHPFLLQLHVLGLEMEAPAKRRHQLEAEPVHTSPVK